MEPLARELRERVHRWVGIPTCVGIALTKTLAQYLRTNTFNNDPFQSNGASARFGETTNDTGESSRLGCTLGRTALAYGFRYSRNGVMITVLMPETIRQPPLWGELDHEKRERAWRAMDKLNATLGCESASSGPVQRRPHGSSGQRSAASIDDQMDELPKASQGKARTHLDRSQWAY